MQPWEKGVLADYTIGRARATVSVNDGVVALNSEWDNWFLDKIEEDPKALYDMTHHELMKPRAAFEKNRCEGQNRIS